MPSLESQFQMGTEEQTLEWGYEEAAWTWIAVNKWIPTPQLLFAIKDLVKEIHNGSQDIQDWATGSLPRENPDQSARKPIAKQRTS